MIWISISKNRGNNENDNKIQCLDITENASRDFLNYKTAYYIKKKLVLGYWTNLKAKQYTGKYYDLNSYKILFP